MKGFSAFLTCVSLLAPVAALADINPAGVWEGTLNTPNGDLGFVFNLHRDGDKWVAEMDVPAQGVTEMPLSNVKVEGSSISIPIPGPGDPHFDGKVSEDGKTISGKFSQGDGTIPLELKWKSAPRAVSKAAANTGEVQVLEGIWEGTLDTGGAQLRLRFNFVKNADGSISGTLDSIDQNVNGVPMGPISRTGDSIKIEVKSIGGSFEGTLDKDAAKLTGTWSQGGGSLPLTMQHGKPAKKS
ncbi:MAG TPA: hypothetical protein VMT86_08010 [Bryobacteraceae bacterium]|nr:hypothetical protein [Bryobacteraceae bacterium]